MQASSFLTQSNPAALFDQGLYQPIVSAIGAGISGANVSPAAWMRVGPIVRLKVEILLTITASVSGQSFDLTLPPGIAPNGVWDDSTGLVGSGMVVNAVALGAAVGAGNARVTLVTGKARVTIDSLAFVAGSPYRMICDIAAYAGKPT